MRWGNGSGWVHRGWRAAGVAGVLLGLSACLEPGQLDPHFGGGDGVVVTNTGEPEASADTAQDLVVQRDGRIVVVGASNNDFAVLRYRRDGTLDPAFGGGDGIVTTDVGRDGGDEEAVAVALQPDGRIVVAGRTSYGRMAVARYTADGQLDTGFSGDGLASSSLVGSPYGGGASGLAIQPDGRIVVVGQASTPDYQVRIGVARYLPDGAPDPAFGTGGELLVDRFWANEADVALQPDGRIVVAGSGDLVGARGDYNVVAARLLPDGTVDSSFGVDGATVVDLDPTAEGNAVALQRDGKVVIGGLVRLDLEGAEQFALVRLTADGAPDPGFDGDGVVTSSFTGSDGVHAVAVQGDGRILAAGFEQGASRAGGFALARYLPDGTLDPGFGGGDGWASTGDLGDIDYANAIALLRNGRVLVAGVTGSFPGTDVGLALFGA